LAICAVAALALLLCDHLSHRGFSPISARAIVALALVQPALLVPGLMGSCYVFALLGYLVGAGAEHFARHQDVRRIVLLGGAIAGAELVNPAGGVLAAAVLPFVLRPEEARKDVRKTTGFLALLLFLPVLFAGAIAYFWLVRHTGTIQWFASGPPSVAWAALAIAPVLPAFAFGRFDSPAAAVVSIVTVAWWSGSLLLASFGHVNYTLATLASMGPLAVLLIASRPQAQGRERKALFATGLGFALSWVVGGVQFL
jgi:hypothetical protein